MSEAFFSVKQLNAGYGPLNVLHDIQLDMQSKARIALVGLNGHGKTTLLRAIMGLAGWQRGSIRLDGQNLLGLPTHRIVHHGVVLIAQGDALFPGMSVRENLDSGAFTTASWKARSAQRDLILALFPPLANRLKQAAGTLSGGERRMLSIGRALMSRARLLLVDEPSLGLSPLVSRLVVEALFSPQLADTALIVAEQNRALIEDKVDQLYVMHGGKLLMPVAGETPLTIEEELS
jgi:branched-chain amino acid transport system ATP-binding protein